MANILENQIHHLNDFIRLNEQWISAHFQLEPVDMKLADNPRVIIDDGGYVFTLVDQGLVIGACALFNQGGGVFELARMAVEPRYHGKGYGHKLINTCLDKLAKIKAKHVYLISNTKLKAAVHLYKNHGFMVEWQGSHPIYARANIKMSRPIIANIL
ncbi:GNAT family N-acetyltransferase [Thalassotalea maritima]|uniref:GNAT family N-acetyltransferase n=1 Tax=Thalassotalea maritima TaxID=3242416 RepID=UPI003527514A